MLFLLTTNRVLYCTLKRYSNEMLRQKTSRHDAELAFMEIRHSYSTFPLKTAVHYPTYPTNGSVPDFVIDNRSLLML